MDFDEVVIGSGLSALGTVLGLPARRRVLVIGGPKQGRSQFYDAARTVPCAHLGSGGLGSYWHGVIPTGGCEDFTSTSPGEFARVFAHFYPSTDVAQRLGRPWLFVPWRPIRPKREWLRLQAERGGYLIRAFETVTRFALGGYRVSVFTDRGAYRGARVWLGAGALHSPPLLDRSLEVRVSRDTVSDHAICYLGLIDRAVHSNVQAPRIERDRHGVWFPAVYDDARTSLCTLRPARFTFARIDHGIEQREVFGLPIGNSVARILRRASAGLLAEALYNRTGLFPAARVQSAYAQVAVPEAYWLRQGDTPLEIRRDIVQSALDAARARQPWPELLASHRPHAFIPGIHLHHSVDLRALETTGANRPAARVQVVDASVLESIGPEHHSFKLMVAAVGRARSLST